MVIYLLFIIFSYFGLFHFVLLLLFLFVFAISYIILLLPFYFYFVLRVRKVVNLNERAGGEDLGGVAGAKIVIRTYYIKICFH